MAPRRIGLVLALTLLGGLAVGVPAQAACAAAPPRVSLTGFTVSDGPRPFYLGREGQPTPFVVRFAGGCAQTVSVDWATQPGTATHPSDYEHETGQEQAFIVNDEPHQFDRTLNVNDGDGPEDIVQSFHLTLSNATSGAGSVSVFNGSAPVLVVDGDGADRVGFEGVPYTQSETFPTARIPVFRAGPVTIPTSVTYAVEPGPGNPATPGADYTVTSPPTLSFATGERYKTIDLNVINDKLGEGAEEVTITLAGPEVSDPSTTTFTIEDNEESVFPTSRFHHPRHKWKYKKSDYRIREFHVFAADEGGSGVVAAEIALRRNLANGKCVWLTTSGWQKKDCQHREWLPTKYDEAGVLFYYRMKQLKSSVGTRIKDYTAFSRAIDGAENVEKEFVKKRNDNTFEIKRTRRRR
jgi:Calx-beta domain